MNELDRLTGQREAWRGRWLALAAVLLLAAYIAAPFVSLVSLRDAIESGDAHTLEKRVDFPAVRTSLKEQFKVRFLASFAKSPEMQGNPFAGLAVAFGPAMVDQMVDAAVTPAGIARLVQEGKIRARDAEVSPVPSRSVRDQVLHKGFVAADDFRVEFVSGTRIWLKPGFPFWRVYKIELPEDERR